MKISRVTEVATKRGTPDYFTGTVWLDEITLGATANVSPLRALRVTFEPGARTAWHTHPHGQTLHILSGVGRVQRAGGEVIEVHPGDSVWFEPGERHWHGASAQRGMVHLALHQADAQGNAATWLEQVSDADYNGVRG